MVRKVKGQGLILSADSSSDRKKESFFSKDRQADWIFLVKGPIFPFLMVSPIRTYN